MPITVERTRDLELVRQILTAPGVYRGKVSPEGFQPIGGEQIVYLIVKEGMQTIGVFVGVLMSEYEMHVHHAFHPVAFGLWTRIAAQRAIDWVWENTKVLKMIGVTPAPLRLALRFADELGFKRFAVDSKSTVYKGELCDQIMTEIYRPKAQHAA